jgi:hypothetical protein
MYVWSKPVGSSQQHKQAALGRITEMQRRPQTTGAVRGSNTRACIGGRRSGKHRSMLSG